MVGPKTRRLLFLNSSTIPRDNGCSGPTIVKSILFLFTNTIRFSISVDPISTFSAISPIPALPGAQNIFDTFLGEYDELKTFFHGHSYSGNPLSCAAAIANLEIFESENTLDDSSITIKQLKGPFEKFEGRWSVAHIDKNSCQIDFDATYELPFLLNAITSDYLANNFSKNIIDSFIERVS